MNALVEDQMVRLRRALDSDEARAVMNAKFHGNRIFFGRLTGQTPITGWDVHPRMGGISDPDILKRDVERRRRRLAELFRHMVVLQKSQEETQEHQLAESSQSGNQHEREAAEAGLRRSARYALPFMFPSVDGGEMTSRWDMQSFPPDILITNISMLSALLTREVDRPIVTKTREWLKSDPDAYFYLVLDELHLHRGAAGTEVAYLLRWLLTELGLTDREHRHKLRILASSASLPTDARERRQDSLDFLWGMFGGNGTFASPGEPVRKRGPADWESSIQAGSQLLPRPTITSPLSPSPFEAFALAQSPLGADEPAKIVAPEAPEFENLWRPIAEAVGVAWTDDSFTASTACMREVALRLAAACTGESTTPAALRATRLTHIADRLFAKQRTPNENGLLLALRGAALVCGAIELAPGWWGRSLPPSVPRFRAHMMFRSIEGLFAVVGHQDPRKSDRRVVAKGCLPAKFAMAVKPG
jgi:hypothetical protein